MKKSMLNRIKEAIVDDWYRDPAGVIAIGIVATSIILTLIFWLFGGDISGAGGAQNILSGSV